MESKVVWTSLKIAFDLARRGHLAPILGELRVRFFSSDKQYGLCRDLSEKFSGPEATIGFGVRPAEPQDLGDFLSVAGSLGGDEALDRLRRRRLIEYGLPTCYVAVTDDGDVCFMQWLIGEQQNDRVQALFSGDYPMLEPGQMLLEYAYIPEKFRGLGIMPRAMSLIAHEAKSLGAERLITFVGVKNVASLKGCKRAGFTPCLVRTDEWRFFRKKVSFEKLLAGTPAPTD
jgi:hypothetical protein